MTNFDEFDDGSKGGFLSSVGPKAAFLVVLIALSFLIGVVWKLYTGGQSGSNSVNVPIVRADSDPTKIIPDDRGGMEVPHRDSTIFSSLSSDKEEGEKIENLLADDENEEPMPRSQLFAGLNTEPNPDLKAESEPTPLDQPVSDKVQPVIEEVKEEVQEIASIVEDAVNEPIKLAPTPEPVEKKVEAVETPKPVEKKPEPVKAPAKVEAPKVVAKKEEPKTSSVASTSGDYVVQLASIKDKSLAEKEWKKFVSKYGSALSGMSYRVQSADLGAKGVFHRIQAGPVSKDKASSVCAAIKQISPNGCIVKKK